MTFLRGKDGYCIFGFWISQTTYLTTVDSVFLFISGNYSPASPKVDIPEHSPGVIGAVRTGSYRGWKPLLRVRGR